MIPSGTYNPLDSTLSALRSRTLLRHPVVIAALLKVSPKAMSTWRCSTIAVFGLSPLTPLSQMIPTSVPAMPNRARVLLMLLGPVSQPTQLVGWVATAASGATVNAVAIGVDAEASATVCSDSRRDPQPSRPITRAPMPVGAFGEAAAVGLKPNAPSTLVTSFCTPAATAFTAAPSDGLAFGLSCMGVATCSVATVETTVSVRVVPVCTTGSTVSIATTVLAVPPVAHVGDAQGRFRLGRRGCLGLDRTLLLRTG